MNIDAYDIMSDRISDITNTINKQISEELDAFLFSQFKLYGFSKDEVTRLLEEGRITTEPYNPPAYRVGGIRDDFSTTFKIDGEKLFSIQAVYNFDDLHFTINSRFETCEYHITFEEWKERKGEKE